MLTRDSAAWWLVIMGSIAGYFATLPPPDPWTWAQYMNILVVVLGMISAQLSSSKLAGSNTPPKDTTTVLGGLFKVYTPKEEEK